MANFRLGMNAKLYLEKTPTLLTGANQAAVLASMTEVPNVRDLTLNLSTGEADITTRDNNGFRAYAATLKDGSVDFEMILRDNDLLLNDIEDAWTDGSERAVFVADQDKATAGAQGLLSNMVVTNFSRSEPLEDAIIISVSLRPSSETEYYEVSA